MRSFPVLLVEEMVTGMLENETVRQLRKPALKERNEKGVEGKK